MGEKIEYFCQLPSCGNTINLPNCVAKNRKYCCKTCSHTHQKKMGIRKNNKNNTIENYIRLYGVEEGTKRHNTFRKKISNFIKENPIKNQSFIRTEEMRQKISKSRKETNNKRKLKLKEFVMDNDYIKKIEYDQLYGDGKYDALKKRMKGVFTLEWFIKKYGDTDGRLKYKERCDNIKKTILV